MPGRIRKDKEQLVKLRKQAQSLLEGQSADKKEIPSENAKALIDELLTNQEEFLKQNEQLKILKLELEASRSNYYELFDRAPVGYFILNSKGIIQDTNRRGAELLGIDRKSLFGVLMRDFKAAGTELRFADFCAKARESQERQEFDIELTSKDKGNFWAHISLDLFMNSESPTDQYLLTVTDITKRKETETALRKAKEEAELATWLKSDFLASMSHEIRTPLNGVVGMTEILSRSRLTKKQKDCLNDLKVSSELLLSIINNILDFSKIESGKLELEDIDFNAENIVVGLCDIIKYQAAGKGLELFCDYDQTAPKTFKGDPIRLRQVLLNLLGNAVKFTSKGKVSLIVKVLSQDAERAEILFEVSDTGIGIPDFRLNSLFSKFTQAERSTTRKYGGSGLGLTISRSLVEKMGGTITVKSREGKGSTFSFTLSLPIATDFECPENKELKLNWKRSPEILLVEDNSMNRKVAEAFLADTGCKVHMAEDGVEAFTKNRTGNYDLIFMDLQMPAMDGVETTRVIRKTEQNRNIKPIPIIAMTANVLHQEKERCLKFGMNAYLTKPLSRTAISRALADNLSHLLISTNEIPASLYESQIEDDTSDNDEYPVFDSKLFLKRLGTNTALSEEIVEAFLKESPQLMNNLHLAIVEDQPKQGTFHAHTLKGMAENLAAIRFAKYLTNIEDLAAAGKSKKLLKRLPDLEDEYEILIKVLKDHQKKS